MPSSPSAPPAAAQATRPIIPPSVIVAAGLLMLASIIVAGIARHSGSYHVAVPPTAAVASRDLRFADRPDGAVIVTDAASGARVATVEPKTGGFLRGIMRGLVREHRINELAAGSAFRLTRWADGRLTIADPQTRESFDLEAFGPTNMAAFAGFLPQAATGGVAGTGGGGRAR